jgi:deltex-like protein
LSDDEAFATKIQSQEYEQHGLSVRQAQERKQLERASMTRTLDGQAWLFIEQVIDLQKKLSNQYPGLQTVAVDDIVFLAKQFIQCQHEFRRNGIDPKVTLAYHYTTDQNMNSIQQDGLMTLADRGRNGIISRENGMFYGDGVYTASNPYAFQTFGNVGLLVAVLLGNARRVLPGGECPFANGSVVNTAIGNKSVKNLWKQVSDDAKLYDELVLGKSKQCLPLFRYDVTLVSCTWQGKVGADAIWSHQVELQKLIDQSFNDGVETKLERILPSTGRHFAPPVTRVKPIMSNPAAMAITPGQRRAAPLPVAALPTKKPPIILPLPVAALPTKEPPNSWFQPGAFRTNSITSANGFAQQPPSPLFGTPVPPGAGSFATANASIQNTPLFSFASHPQRAPPLAIANASIQNTPPTVFASHAPTLSFDPFGTPAPQRAASVARANVSIQNTPPTVFASHAPTLSFDPFSTPAPHRASSLATANASIQNTPPNVGVLYAPPFSFNTPASQRTASLATANVSILNQIQNTPPFGAPHPIFGATSLLAASFPAAHQTFQAPPFVAAASPFQSISHEDLMYTAPATLTTFTPSNAFQSCAASLLSHDECPICMEALDTFLVKVTVCGHIYHRECIENSLKVSSRCPICRRSIKNPQGQSPSGSMTISSTGLSFLRCKGFEDDETIVIEYDIPCGYQKAYHPSPGHSFRGGRRTAYLPNNEDGRNLLERLKLAWMLGMTFTVGESLSSGRSNVVTWASIHHKTSTSGGSHGFPDPAYFFNCNEELDSLGVPKPLRF